MDFNQINWTHQRVRAKRWTVRRGRFIAPTADLSAHENPPTYLPNRLRLSHGRQLAASHIINETADLYILWDER